MNDWFSLDLGDQIDAYEPCHRILDAYSLAYVASGAPADMAVFNQRTREKKTRIIAYFTPSASRLAQAFGATSCEKPTSSDDMVLLVGSQVAWDIHFPSRKQRRDRST